MTRLTLLAIGSAGLCLSLSFDARASNGLEVPDAGVLQVGRGGAWVARADDPMAAYMNPAAMSFQATSIHVGTHLMIQQGCFTRLGPDGQPVSPGPAIPQADAPKDPVCTTSIFPNPQLAAVYRISDRWAVGLAVLGPHAAGSASWPEEIDYTTQTGLARTQPAPNRYIITDQSAVLVYPTLSVSYAPLPELSFGAGFVWGFAAAEFTTFTESISGPGDDFTRDVKAVLSAKDLFVPGFVLGANWGVTRYLDFGAWYRWSDAIRARTELELTSSYWLGGGTRNESPCPESDPRCNITTDADAGELVFPIPMEAKLGLRFHLPLGESTVQPHWVQREAFVRDPLTQDRFDIEVDLTWANNSAVQDIELTFDEGIAVKGTPGFVPVNGNIPHDWRDVLGIRLGSDITAVPNLLALRLGGFFESKGARDELLNLDFHQGFKGGISGGATFRVWLVDIHAAYQHVFYGTLDNGGDGELRALSGDATSGYRSEQTVNGGSFEQSLDEVGLGATIRF
jgi:long-chain fatty acid transport protein